MNWHTSARAVLMKVQVLELDAGPAQHAVEAMTSTETNWQAARLAIV